nr:AAA domain-containing protein [Nonomuraea sp. FMUSA5-5]
MRTPVDLDKAESLYLADGQGRGVRYSVFETFSDKGLLYVRVMESARAENLVLWIQQRASGALLQSLGEQLRSLRPSPLTTAFAAGRLSPLPTPGRHGLNDEQDQAVSACIAKGLHAIWGPPGTGKTRVIAHALRALRSSGTSALLVSGTNIAVDNALERAAELIPDLRAGEFVRVGVPVVQAVADDDRLALTRLTRASLARVEQERASIVTLIDEIRRDARLTALAQAQQQLAEFDPAAYAAAKARIAEFAEHERAHARLQQARTHCAEAAERKSALDALAEQAGAACRARETDRQLHAEAARLQEELHAYRLAADRALLRVEADTTRLHELNERLREQESQPIWKRRRRAGLTALRGDIGDAQAALAASRQRFDQVNEALARTGPELQRRIAAYNQAASCSVSEIGRLDAEHARLSAEAMAARQSLHQAEAVLRQAEHALHTMQRAPEPSADDLRLTSEADEAGLPTVHARMSRLRAAAQEPMRQLTDLERQHEKVLDKLRRLQRDAEQELIDAAQVVATTHAMLRMRPALHKRSYDHVIIDEAAASYPAEVLYAISKATSGATLLGDPMQSLPIVELPEPHSDAVTTWLARDAFTTLGIDGQRPVPGCVTLTTQYRFGPAITELANLLAYDGRLVAGRPASDEIVLVDTVGLASELATVRWENGSACWGIGPLLARALAEHHLAAGETSVGVITPYRQELNLITDVFTDTDVSAKAEAGTVYRFQGREFTTVIVDLVEDGGSRIARGSPKARNTFNVAVTRARDRLYILAPLQVVAGARVGPLRVLGDLYRQGRVTVVAAADLLGLEQAPEPAGARRALWDALRAYVKIVGLYDEELLPDELLAAIEAAEHSVWVWSPWVGKRVSDILPTLRAAVARGVDVRAVVLPPRDKEERYEPYVEALRQAIRNVVFLQEEHQKLAVIDRKLTFIGSMNVLSHQRVGGRREVMTVMHSRHFAAHLLRHERADEFGRPPTCPACRQQREAALRGSGSKRRLHWLCPPPCRHPLSPFPDIDGGRHQRRAPRRPRP